MQLPLEITVRNVQRTPDLDRMIERRVSKLEKVCDHITRCHVTVERPHEHATSGNPYRVALDITVPPGHEIVVDKRPRDHDLHDTLRTVIGNAFEAAERQLQELVQRQRGAVKGPPARERRALVVKLFPEEGYGFLRAMDADHEIYFHRNSVAESDDFDDLAVGTEVRYEEALGEMGPQATTVKIISKPGKRTDR
jgi:cold shock CspA family protein/ribosome-associated translation inhibitor RaiA